MSNVTKEFMYSDAGSPVLSGNTPGSVIALLDACLVNGYNITTPSSIVVTSNVAVVTANTNTYTVGQCILVSGVTSPTELNGEKYITAITSNTYSYSSNSANGSASGSFSVKVAPLGWISGFSSANIKSWQQSTGQLRYVQLDNTSAQMLKYSLFETMTAANTGTNQTPTAAQNSNYCAQLATTTATAASTKFWYLIGNDRSFYFFISPDGTTNYAGIFAGDYVSYKSGDLYGTMISGANAPSLTTPATTTSTYFATTELFSVVTNWGKYILRPYTGVGSSQIANLGVDRYLLNTSGAGVPPGLSGVVYPNAPDGSLLMGEIRVSDTTTIRGELPGVLCMYHANPFVCWDTFDGAGATAGNKYRAFTALGALSPFIGQIAIKRLSPWTY